MKTDLKRFLKVFPYEKGVAIPIQYGRDLLSAIEREAPEETEKSDVIVRALEECGYIEVTVHGERKLTSLGIAEGLPYGVGCSPAVEKISSSGDESAWKDFRCLCRYFIDCVSLSEQEQNFIHYKNWNTQWFLPSMPVGWSLKTQKSTFRISISQREKPAYNFLIASGMDGHEIFLGYPTCDVWTGNTDQKNPIFTSLFLIPAHISPLAGTNQYDLELDFSEIRINTAWFEYNLGEMPRDDFFRTLSSFEDSEGRINLKDAITFLENRISAAKSQQICFEADSLCFDLQNFKKGDRKIRNTAILFRGNEVRYNKGLIRDLKIISDASAESLDQTALAYVFRNPPISPSGGVDDHQSCAIPFIPANEAQTTAVEDALNSRISVVTGPPGTGKSQVAVNIIANLILRGGSVLFTSKNHKAIHAIQDKVASLEDSCNVNPAEMPFPLVEFCSNPDGSDGVEWKKVDMMKRLGAAQSIALKLEGVEKFIQKDKALEFIIDAERKISGNTEKVKRLKVGRRKLTKILVETRDLEDTLQTSFDSSPEKAQNKDTDSLRKKIKLAEKYMPTDSWSRLKRFVAWICRYRKKFERIFSELKEELPEVRQYTDNVDSWFVDLTKFCDTIDRWKECANKKSALLEELGDAEKEFQKAAENLFSLWGRLCRYDEDETHISQKLQELWLNIQVGRVCGISDKEHDFYRENFQTFDNLARPDSSKTLSRDELLDAEKAFQVLLKFFPAWACTSLSLRKASPCLPGVFTRVVIDEAAQCDMPSIIPALYRAKGAVVIGDDQQFPPVITLSPKKHDSLWKRHELNQCYNGTATKFSFLNRQGSVYGVFSKRKPPILLNEHFRCDSEIAEYFNQTYYNGKLIVRTPDRSLVRNMRSGRSWIDVKNSISGELSAVEEHLRELSRIGYLGSIGIITPLRKTADELRQKLYPFAGKLPGFDIQNDINTVNGFQGGERDVIIFVLGITDELRGGQAWYPEAEENRYIYNVAVSRARTALIVVGDKSRAKESRLRELRALAKDPSSKRSLFESPYEEKLWDAMRKRGLDPKPQYPVAGRYLDLALVDKKIDVEVDGVEYHMNSSGQLNDSDIQREITLKANGWRTIRFWSYEISKSPDACVEKILQLYHSTVEN